jgi:hypothetical protein
MKLALKPENIAQLVFFIRCEKVMLDADLARLCGVSTKALNQALRRNRERFPEDFVFQLKVRQQAAEEAEALVHANRNRSFHELSPRCSRTRLDSVAACRLGKMLDPRFKTGVGSTPYLRNANVQWDRLDLTDVCQMDFKDEERTEFALQSGDILVCEGGDIGKAAIWNDEILGCCYQKALHRVRCDRERTLPRFILHHLFWAANEGHWQEIKTQTTIPHLTGLKLKAYEVFVPPLPEQHRIVAELDALQAEVDSLKRLQAETAAELDALLPSIFDKAFKGEL